MRVPRQLLRETITVEDYAGTGARGPVYVAGRPVRASMQQTSRLMSDARGNQITVDILATIRPENGPVPPESRVTWGSLVFRVAASHPYPDSRRPSHYELSLVDTS